MVFLYLTWAVPSVLLQPSQIIFLAFFSSFKKLLLKGGSGHLYPFAVGLNRKNVAFIKRRNVIKTNIYLKKMTKEEI